MRGTTFSLTTGITADEIAYAEKQQQQLTNIDWLMRHGRPFDLTGKGGTLLSSFYVDAAASVSGVRYPCVNPNYQYLDSLISSGYGDYGATYFFEWNGLEKYLVFWGLCREKDGTEDLIMDLEIYNLDVTNSSTETPVDTDQKTWTNAEVSTWTSVSDGTSGQLTHTMTIDSSIDSLVPSQGLTTPNKGMINAFFRRSGDNHLKITPAYLFLVNTAPSRS